MSLKPDLSSSRKELDIHIEKIRKLSLQLFENDVDKANAWLNSKLYALSYKTPLEFADNVSNAKQIETLIKQLEYGIFV